MNFVFKKVAFIVITWIAARLGFWGFKIDSRAQLERKHSEPSVCSVMFFSSRGKGPIYMIEIISGWLKFLSLLEVKCPHCETVY
jgi:hypothetical protein